MRTLRLLLAIGLVATPLVACKKDKTEPKPTTTETPKTEPPKTEPPKVEPPKVEPPKPEEPKAENTTDVPLTHVRLNLDEHKEWKPVPSLPKGAEMAVLEGEPPFPAGKAMTFLLKLPKDYKVPPHTHLVSERVTILKGSLNFGHGEKFDKKKTQQMKAGGIVVVPAGHAHFVWTSEEMILQLQGVGPWGIYYIDPKDDPRGDKAPAKPEKMDHPTDNDLADAIHLNQADIKWSAGPASLPPGAEMSVIEGAAPFPAGKAFVFRLKVPDGYKVPVHHHLVTERVTVISGTFKFGMGDKWNDADMKEIKPGGVVFMPKEHKHFVQAKGETVVQVQGVGPWGIIYANPDEDPRNAKK
jgi:quercetin dioxygenase-like cupin family protein